MKKKYAFHPSDYAIGETEKFYSDMAAKGWILEKRNGILSIFKKSEPQKLRYRVEVIPSSLFAKEEEKGPSSEQLALFKDCGWKYVTGFDFIYIFSTKMENDAPEFYVHPEQQAPTIKKMRNRYILKCLLYLLAFFFFGKLLISRDFNLLSFVYGSMVFFVDNPIFILTYYLFFLLNISISIIGFIKLNKLYYQLKNGIPIDHSPKLKRFNIAPIEAIIVICFFISLFTTFPNKTYPLPTESNGPYILLSDLGIEGSREDWDLGGIIQIDNEVEYYHSLLAEHWYCEEHIITRQISDNSSEFENMSHDVYRLNYSNLCIPLAKSLMVRLTFADSPAEFTEVEVSGFDHVWTGYDYWLIAIKNEYVYFIGRHHESEEEMMVILQAIADKNYE